MLQGKKILIAGGNGFVGNYLASRFVQQKAIVSILSRRGPKHNYPENKELNWLIGDIMEPAKYEQQINDADVVIHSLGALIDTVIMKRREEGAPGSYEQMNRDSLSSLLNIIDGKKLVFYMSALDNPPFVTRYRSTKEEAEQILNYSGHQAHIVKAGLIYNWEHRKWSVPLRHQIDLWNRIYPSLFDITPNGSLLQRFLMQFRQSEPTPLKIIAESMIKVIQHGEGPNFLHNKQMKQFSESFQNDLARQKY